MQITSFCRETQQLRLLVLDFDLDVDLDVDGCVTMCQMPFLEGLSGTSLSKSTSRSKSKSTSTTGKDGVLREKLTGSFRKAPELGDLDLDLGVDLDLDMNG